MFLRLNLINVFDDSFSKRSGFVNISKRPFLFGTEQYFWHVKTFRKIVVIGLSVLFFFMSTGVVLYQTHCECFGISKVSLFAASKQSDHTNTEDNCCFTESEYANYKPDILQQSCGCDLPVPIYLKLSSHLGEGSILEYPMAKIISLQNVAVIETVEQLLPVQLSVHFTYYAPPDNKKAGRTLVNFLKQYKIALLA